MCAWLLSLSLRSLIQGTVREPLEFYQMIEGNACAWGKAVATIDASAARVFADRWCQNSHEYTKRHVEKEGPDALIKVIYTEDSHSMLYVNLVRLTSPVSNRVFATWFSWRKEPDNSFLIALAPLEDFSDKSDDAAAIAEFMAKQKERRAREGKTEDIKYFQRDAEELELMMQQRAVKKAHVNELNDLIKQDPIASMAVRGTFRGYWRIKPLAPSVCQVTYLGQAELGGSIPSAIINASIKDTLGLVQTMQVKLARNGKLVDKEMRNVFASPPPLVELSEELRSVVEDCRSLESEDGREWETIASPSSFVTMWIKHAPAKENERSIAIGKATAVIDCRVHEAAGELSDCELRGTTSMANYRPAPLRVSTGAIACLAGWSEPPALNCAF